MAGMHNQSSGFDQIHVRRDRMFHTSRWKRRTMASNIVRSALALSAALAMSSLADAKTITAVMHSDLRIIDPGFTTAYITRDHGYMVYDTLLATDANFKIQPQMAEWKVSDDKLTYTFTLRDGLKWHDGAPVTAEDCVASLKRWGRNDCMGQTLMDFTASLEATDGKTITPKLQKALLTGTVHDAEPDGGNPGRPANQGPDRLRSVQVRAGGIPARRQGGL